GLVTIEDLVEEIVGEIFDEYELAETMIEPLGKNRIRVDARINLDKINELFDVDLPQADYDTVGGFVYHLIGKIPRAGERVEFQNLVFTVEQVVKRRISKILVSRQQKPAGKGDADLENKKERI
ncbi:MAG: transporter associated domain-containing protein, partial [Terriglobia bacterium]